MPKKVLVALPPGLLEDVDHIADIEHRTRSELIREALRRYINSFQRQQGAARLQILEMGKPQEPEITPSTEPRKIKAYITRDTRESEPASISYDPELSAALH